MHFYDLAGVDDFDPGIRAIVLFEFRFDLRSIADKKQLRDMGILVQRHNGSADDIWRAEIAAHGIESDFHRSGILRRLDPECKIKNVAFRQL